MSDLEFQFLWKTPGLKISKEEMVYFILQLSGHTLLMRKVRAEIEGRNLEKWIDVEAMEECCLQAYIIFLSAFSMYEQSTLNTSRKISRTPSKNREAESCFVAWVSLSLRFISFFHSLDSFSTLSSTLSSTYQKETVHLSGFLLLAFHINIFSSWACFHHFIKLEFDKFVQTSYFHLKSESVYWD